MKVLTCYKFKFEDYFGAEVGSNNTGELSAIAALRWILINCTNETVEICTDSTYAGNIASGKWKAKANKLLAAKVQIYGMKLKLIKNTWRHVRAHRVIVGMKGQII